MAEFLPQFQLTRALVAQVSVYLVSPQVPGTLLRCGPHENLCATPLTYSLLGHSYGPNLCFVGEEPKTREIAWLKLKLLKVLPRAGLQSAVLCTVSRCSLNTARRFVLLLFHVYRMYCFSPTPGLQALPRDTYCLHSEDPRVWRQSGQG